MLIHTMRNPLEPVVKQLDKIFWPTASRPTHPRSSSRPNGTGFPRSATGTSAFGTASILSTSGDVTIDHPFVITDLPLLPDLSQADLTVKAEVTNHSGRRQEGVLRGRIGEVGSLGG